jgi:uncharacterized protein YndB with AHSA1/START domain
MKLCDLTATNSINAPAEAIFDIWMDPKSPGSPWFGCERVIMNPAVDGLFYHTVEHQGRIWPHYGRFVRLDRPHRIEHTWVSESTRGLETLLTLTFETRDGHTEVELRHTGVPDDEDGRKHKVGWTWLLSALAERFESPAGRLV